MRDRARFFAKERCYWQNVDAALGINVELGEVAADMLDPVLQVFSLALLFQGSRRGRTEAILRECAVIRILPLLTEKADVYFFYCVAEFAEVSEPISVDTQLKPGIETRSTTTPSLTKSECTRHEA